jgi:hypothetical protein
VSVTPDIYADFTAAVDGGPVGGVPAGPVADGAGLPVLEDEALYGLTGRVVNTILPHSEASAPALLVQFLAAVGNSFGRGAHVPVEGDRHTTNLFVAIVGDTSTGRKGTSWGRVRQLLTLADADWAATRVIGGLASGKQVQIKDGKPPKPTGETVEELVDEEVADKRLLVQESELARVLRVMRREGNTLSPVIRQLWDTGSAASLSKNQPGRTTGALLSICAHITPDEVRRELRDTDAANGFANRFLWVWASRSKLLPRGGGDLPQSELQALAEDVGLTQRHASIQEAMTFDARAWEVWETRYGALSTGRPGLLGAVLGRAAPQVLRLALLYALLDLSTDIRAEHLHAALAVWRYCEQSARLIFGGATGYPDADRALEFIKAGGEEGRTTTEVRDHFGRNRTVEPILKWLHNTGLVQPAPTPTGGRPATRWVCTEHDINDANDRGPLT